MLVLGLHLARRNLTSLKECANYFWMLHAGIPELAQKSSFRFIFSLSGSWGQCPKPWKWPMCFPEESAIVFAKGLVSQCSGFPDGWIQPGIFQQLSASHCEDLLGESIHVHPKRLSLRLLELPLPGHRNWLLKLLSTEPLLVSGAALLAPGLSSSSLLRRSPPASDPCAQIPQQPWSH